MVSFLFKASSFTTVQNQSSHKHITPRLQILLQFLESFSTYEGRKRITKESFPLYNPVLPILKQSMEATTMQGQGVD